MESWISFSFFKKQNRKREVRNSELHFAFSEGSQIDAVYTLHPSSTHATPLPISTYTRHKSKHDVVKNIWYVRIMWLVGVEI